MINVRETMMMGASVKDACDRLNILLEIEGQYGKAVESTNVSGCSETWEDAYCRLLEAIRACVKAEKDIILNA